MTALLGIDLGTSQAKALLCAPDGRVLGQGAAGYGISTPREGWAETDPAQWWRAVRTAVRSAGAGSGSGSGHAVAAMAITGQMHGLVLCSERAEVLRPAILWLDRRATSEVADYQRLPEAVRGVLGNAPSPGMAGPLALWLARHEPDAYRRARWQFQPKDWLRLRLTGEAATDPTDASGTLLFDLTRDDWAFDVAERLGLRTDFLPPVRGSAAAAGRLLPGAAEELGLTPGIPVATGCADTAASLLAVSELPGPLAAAGLAGDGWALLTLGTGGQWIVPVQAAEPDPSGRTNLFRSVDGFYRLGGAQNVGAVLDWVRRTLNATWDELYATATPRRPGYSAPGHSAPGYSAPGYSTPGYSTPGYSDFGISDLGLVFDPRLTAERWDQPGVARGGWTGVTLAHDRDDLMHAALLGVAGLLRDRLADLRAVGCSPDRVLVSGGGSRHAGWRDLLAGVLGLPLVPAETPWLTARGATLLAARLL